MQLPQLATVREAPQLSAAVTVPHVAPTRAQNAVSLSGTQAQTLVPPHVSGSVHAPHETPVRAAPQLSVPATAPQFFPRREQNAGFVSGAQPHWLAVTPPQL